MNNQQYMITIGGMDCPICKEGGVFRVDGSGHLAANGSMVRCEGCLTVMPYPRFQKLMIIDSRLREINRKYEPYQLN